MGLVSTIKGALTATREKPSPRSTTDAPAGAFWCTDCDARLLPGDADATPDSDETQTCPDCGSRMRFERSPDSGDCAC